MTRRRCIVLLLILVMVGLPVSIALAGGTTTITASGDNQPVGNSGGNDWWWGQSFAVASGVVTQITIKHGPNVGSPVGTATWEIRENAAGQPGAVLGSGTYTPTASVTNTLTVSGPLLSAGTTYWLVVHSTSPQASNIQWRWQSSTSSTYAGGNASLSTNGGSTWAAQSTLDLESSITTTDPTATPTASNTPTATNTGAPTATYTPSATATGPTLTPSLTLTPTHTPSPTPNLYYVATVSSGQAVAIQYTLTGGEALIAALQTIQVVILLFGLFLFALRHR